MILNGLREVVDGLRSLVFPELCIVCQREYVDVCGDCITSWQSSPRRFTINTLQIHATVPYSNEVSSAVLKAKEDGLRSAQKLLANALTRSIISWSEGVDLNTCVLVPIPSSKKAIRRRGGSFLHPILQISTNELKRRGFRLIEWKEVLKHSRSVLDQSQLNFEQRKANLNNAFQLIRNDREIKALTNKQIILIDDVVTSGATLLSAESTLRERKMTVLGAVTACATSRQLLIR